MEEDRETAARSRANILMGWDRWPDPQCFITPWPPGVEGNEASEIVHVSDRLREYRAVPGSPVAEHREKLARKERERLGCAIITAPSDKPHRLAEWWTNLDKPQREGVGIGAILLFAVALWIALVIVMRPTWQIFQAIFLVLAALVIIISAFGLAIILPKRKRARTISVCAVVPLFFAVAFVTVDAIRSGPSTNTVETFAQAVQSAAPATQHPRPRPTVHSLPKASQTNRPTDRPVAVARVSHAPPTATSVTRLPSPTPTKASTPTKAATPTEMPTLTETPAPTEAPTLTEGPTPVPASPIPQTHLSFVQKAISAKSSDYPYAYEITIQTDHELNPVALVVTFNADAIIDKNSVVGFGIADGPSMEMGPISYYGRYLNMPMVMVKARTDPPMSPDNPFSITVQSKSSVSVSGVYEVPFSTGPTLRL